MTNDKTQRLRQLVTTTACVLALTGLAPACDSDDAPFVPASETHVRKVLQDGTIVHDHSTAYMLADGTADQASSRTVTKLVRGNRSWETEAEYRGETLKLAQDERSGTLTVTFESHVEHLEQLPSGHYRYRGETYPDNEDGRVRVGKAMADSTMRRDVPAGPLWEGVRGLAVAQAEDGHRLNVVAAIAAAATAFCDTLANSKKYESFVNSPVDPEGLPGNVPAL